MCSSLITFYLLERIFTKGWEREAASARGLLRPRSREILVLISGQGTFSFLLQQSYFL